MDNLITKLDNIANEAQNLGFIRLASEIDKVSNSLAIASESSVPNDSIDDSALKNKIEDILKKKTGYSLSIYIDKISEGSIGHYVTVRILHKEDTHKSTGNFSSIPVPKSSVYFSGDFIFKYKSGKIFVDREIYGRAHGFLSFIKDELSTLIKNKISKGYSQKESYYKGKEDIVNTTKPLTGSVHYLERGENVKDRPMIKAVASLLVGSPVSMRQLTNKLDQVASKLEARGLVKLAYELDVVANTLEEI